MMVDFLIDEMKSMIKEELTIEKENLNQTVKNIKMLKNDADKAINFMNENKELKDKIIM